MMIIEHWDRDKTVAIGKSCNNILECLVGEGRVVLCRVLPFVCFVLLCPLLLMIGLGVQVYT